MKNIIYYSVLSFLVSLTPHPVNAADTMTSESNIFLNGNLQSQLQTQLKRNDYNNFYFNLVNFSLSYTLKNGSKFYVARRDDLDSASAIVIDSIGYFYMAL